MLAGLEMIKQLDARVPAEFVEEFEGIAKGYLTPFTRLMKKIKGPAYTVPQFEHIKLDAEDTSVEASTKVGDIPDHDIVDMTQPSQYVDVATHSSARPPKIATRRMKGEKWSITKMMSMEKKAKIYDEWGWGLDGRVKIGGQITPCGYQISDSAMRSLGPNTWVDDRIIYAYMV